MKLLDFIRIVPGDDIRNGIDKLRIQITYSKQQIEIVMLWQPVHKSEEKPNDLLLGVILVI